MILKGPPNITQLLDEETTVQDIKKVNLQSQNKAYTGKTTNQDVYKYMDCLSWCAAGFIAARQMQ